MAIRKKPAAKKPAAKKPRVKNEVNLLAIPLSALTLKELTDAGVLNENSKGPPIFAVPVQLSPEDIARIAKAVAEISQKRREG